MFAHAMLFLQKACQLSVRVSFCLRILAFVMFFIIIFAMILY